MSAAQQAKAKRRQMRSGYANLGNSRRRPRISGMSNRTVSEAIAAAHNAAARAAASASKKK